MNLLGMSYEEVMKIDFNQPNYRNKQIFEGLHKQGIDYEKMSSLPLKLRKQLAEQYPLPVVTLKEVFTSELDDTRKLIYSLEDGHIVEVVLMHYHYGWTICTPSQVGCAMGCGFCASTLDGKIRNLDRAELLSIFYKSSAYIGEIGRVVLMGSGEPLDNYDEVLGYLRLLTDERGRNLSARHITLSTCGLIDQIHSLANENLPITLAISLHAPNDRIRRKIMPIANKFPVNDLIKAGQYYQDQTGRRVSMEYTLIEGVNDSLSYAVELANKLKGRGFHVNLISVNPLEERDYSSPLKNVVEQFKIELEARNINVTIRRELGNDISGSCGQLRNRHVKLEKRR